MLLHAHYSYFFLHYCFSRLKSIMHRHLHSGRKSYSPYTLSFSWSGRETCLCSNANVYWTRPMEIEEVKDLATTMSKILLWLCCVFEDITIMHMLWYIRGTKCFCCDQLHFNHRVPLLFLPECYLNILC